jgi:hypothetical protein
MRNDKCEICGKKTNISTGWHLKIKQKLHRKQIYLDFCSYGCIADYIEKNMSLMFEDLNKIDKRLDKLERRNKR